MVVVTHTLTMLAQITGVVVSEETGDSIPSATVGYRGRNVNVKADGSGRFTVPRLEGRKLTVSSVGYKAASMQITPVTGNHLVIKLKTDTRMLKELTVDAKRSKYSRKDNPAVELMRRVIAAKKATDLAAKDYYQYTDYQKVTVALNDLKPIDLEKGFFKNHPKLKERVESWGIGGKLVLPLLVDEKVTEHYYRKSPHDERTNVIGSQASGLNDILETGDIVNMMVKDAFSTVDIYDDQIRLLRQRFTSPIGRDAIGFYRYYINDTLDVNGSQCIHLSFLPNNPQDIGFRGELYVVNDSSLHVKKVKLGLPKNSIVNFVENMETEIEYTKLPTGDWVVSVNDMLIELRVNSWFGFFVVNKKGRYSDYRFEAPRDDKVFKGKQKDKVDPQSDLRDENFWAEYRGVPLTKSEKNMSSFIDHLKEIKGFRWAAWILKAFIENYIETGINDNPSKFDIGPVNTLVSMNDMDGLRMRFGGTTTANLNKHLFLSGYVAHGFRTNRWYYKGNVTYSLNAKKYLPQEFPKNNISFESTYDICSPSDRFTQRDKDNMFSSLKWDKVSKMMFYNTQRIEYSHESYSGLKLNVSLRAQEDEATGGLLFKRLSEYPEGVYDGRSWENYYPYEERALHNGKMRTTEVRVELEYSPGAKYFNTKQRQLPLNREAPVMGLTHTIGIKGFLGGEYSYNATEAKIYKRFWLNSWGFLNCYLKAGIQWSQIPYPLLMAPASNMSYIITKESFNLINNSEFMNDRYASIDIGWEMNGKLFNRIPLLKKLKWREYIGFKSLWGGLSDKNNPMLEQNWNSDILMAFPEGYHTMNPNEPYCEMVVGIHNILRFFSVDYVRRLNYINSPSTKKGGIRFTVKMTF